jgi:hypothetical protein
LRVEEVRDLHLPRRAFGCPCLSPSLGVPHEFFLLRSARADRIAAWLGRTCPLMDREELRVALRR